MIVFPFAVRFVCIIYRLSTIHYTSYRFVDRYGQIILQSVIIVNVGKFSMLWNLILSCF